MAHPLRRNPNVTVQIPEIASNSIFGILLVKNVFEPSPLLITEGQWAFCWCMMSQTSLPLAEKNMCNLVAQREQAERSRITETLDDEVKRWSSGKEGNIRVLLSKLQYILGSESGWQRVPLTEVITSAAVKRAYRKKKHTLCSSRQVTAKRCKHSPEIYL